MSCTTVRVTKKVHDGIKELVNFFECGTQNEIVRYGCIALLDKALDRTSDVETIEKLCQLKKNLISKIA